VQGSIHALSEGIKCATTTLSLSNETNFILYRVRHLKCYKILSLKAYIKSKICSDKSFVSSRGMIGLILDDIVKIRAKSFLIF